MANEIKITAKMKCSNGSESYPGLDTIHSVTQATTRPANLIGQGSVNVSTAAAITIPGIAGANYGWTQFYNLDADSAKYIDIGPESDGATIETAIRIYGGGPPAMVQLIPSKTYWAVASTGTQVMLMVAFAK